MIRRAKVKWSQVKVGLLVFVALTMLIAMIMNLEEGMGLIARQTQYRAIVDHTQGLKVGGPVRMNGVNIGNVHRIGLAKDSPRVEISFAVRREVAAHIRQDATVSIRPMGLLGDKFLELLPGSSMKPPLAPGSLLLGRAEVDVSGLTTDASATLGTINATLQDLQRLLAGLSQGQGTAGKLISDPALYEQSQRVLEKLDSASEKGLNLLAKVERGEGTVGRLIMDRELYARANQALKEVTELTGKLNNQNGTLVKLADPTLYSRLENLTVRSEELLRKLERGEGTIGKLVSRDELYTRADKLLTEVEDLVADVKKHPTKYFKFSVF
jgi:phospholipid/cholesterol/gamma-HCH transport system substrate-binding protein